MRRMVRRLVLPCAALAGLSSSASAADQLAIAEPLIPVFSWTGAYAGVHAGYRLNDPELTASALVNSSATSLGPSLPPFTASSISAPGAVNGTFAGRLIGGAQLGYNVQFGIWILGIETDISAGRRRIGTNATATGIVPCIGAPCGHMTTSSFAEAEIDWYGTTRARLGVARDRWVVYVSGGLAYGSAKVSNSGTFSGDIFSYSANSIVPFGLTSSVSNSRIMKGWAAGVGGAFALTDTVSIFAEWTRIDLGNLSAFTSATQVQVPPNTGFFPIPPTLVSSGTSRSDVTFRFDVISVGLNIKL